MGPASRFLKTLAIAAAGRLIIYVLLRDHWGWQPPYHLAFLIPPDGYNALREEYLVQNMPLYPWFLHAIGRAGLDLYVAAPIAQSLMQLAAVALLAVRVAAIAGPPHGVVLAFVLGLDPWLTDTAIVLQPAGLTATAYLLLVERSLAWSARTLARGELMSVWRVSIPTAVICAVATYARADFLSYAALPPAIVSLSAYLRARVPARRALAFAVGGAALTGALVMAALVPRSLLLQRKAGVFVLTTHTGGGALWYGLGEIPNPWHIPNPETGDVPIVLFARERGYGSPFGSARTNAFFKTEFAAHVRERPAFLAIVIMHRAYRTLLGWPPTSVTFRGNYEPWPQMAELGREVDRGASKWRLLVDRRYGPWVLKLFALRYLATALIWATIAAAALFLIRRRTASPLLLLPLAAYIAGIGVFVLVHWSYRYGQQFYWLGYLASSLMLMGPSARARTD